MTLQTSPSKKTIVFITHASQGTLGDPSSCSKLITAMLNKYGTEFDIHFVLSVDETTNIDAVKNMIPKNVTFHAFRNLLSEPVENALRKSSAVVFYPTFHFFGDSKINEFRGYQKPTFVATEYNLYEVNRKKQEAALKNWMASFETGMGLGHLGIFITTEALWTPEDPAISLIDDKSDIAFRDLLLNSSTEKDYHQSHELYMGYFNKLNSEHVNCQVDPMMFIEDSLALNTSKKNIDFVLQITEESADKKSKRRGKSIDDITNYISQNPDQFKDYKFEYYVKKEGKMQKLLTFGEGTKVVRLINGYPLTPKSMSALMKASNPFCFVTGDQSLSEAISNNKIFLYQTMLWKGELFKAIIEETRMLLGEGSILYQFFQLQFQKTDDPKQNRKQLKLFLIQHQADLLKQMKILNNHLYDKKNLYNTLPEAIVNCIKSPQEYIKQCISRGIALNLDDIDNFLNMYPKNVEVVFETVINEHIVEKNILLEYIFSSYNILKDESLQNLLVYFATQKYMSLDKFLEHLKNNHYIISSDALCRILDVYSKNGELTKKEDIEKIVTLMMRARSSATTATSDLKDMFVEQYVSLSHRKEIETYEVTLKDKQFKLVNVLRSLDIKIIVPDKEKVMNTIYETDIQSVSYISPLFGIQFNDKTHQVSLRAGSICKLDKEDCSIPARYNLKCFQNEINDFFKEHGLTINFSDLIEAQTETDYMLTPEHSEQLLQTMLASNAKLSVGKADVRTSALRLSQSEQNKSSIQSKSSPKPSDQSEVTRNRENINPQK